MFRILGVSFLTLASFSFAFAQAEPITAGEAQAQAKIALASRNAQPVQLQVRITWRDNRSVTDPVHVYLLTSSNSPVVDTFNERDGLVLFREVTPGRYRLKLEGETIKEITTDIFEIGIKQNTSSTVMQWVQVERKTPATADNTPNSGPMVSAVELNAPPKAKSEYEKGVEALAKGDLKTATERFEKAVELYPKYGLAWSNLGLVRIRMKDEAGAREAWLKAIEADDKLPSAYLNLARLDLQEKKLQEAGTKIDKALQIDPTNAEGLAMLSEQQLLSGEYDKAIATARKVHSMPHEHLAQVHLICGDALQHQGKNAEALAEYELYLKEYPDSPRVAQVRAAMAQLQARVQNEKKNNPN